MTIPTGPAILALFQASSLSELELIASKYICPAILAFLLGSSLAWLELVTSKYLRTLFLIKKHWALIVYSLIYGVISSLAVLVWDLVPGLTSQGATNPWFRALVAGFSSKALLHIRLFTFPGGSPFGTESIVHLFEPALLQSIDLNEFSEVRKFVQIKANKYNDLKLVKTEILANLPRLDEAEKKSFETDIEKATTVVASMEAYLRRFGSANFNRVFPL
jgi:hypothetical protein